MTNLNKITTQNATRIGIRKFAVEQHGKQKYADKTYIYHLDMVFEEAINNQDNLEGYYAQKFKLPKDYADQIMKLCYTHDMIEDTELSHYDLAAITDVDNADRSKRLSVNHSKHIDDYYQQIAKHLIDSFVKLCDRLANVKFSIDNPSEKSTNALNKYRSHQPIIKNYFLHHTELKPMLDELDKLLKQ